MITHTGAGTWSVRFPAMASPGGNVQVTAYGSVAAKCKVVRWYAVGVLLWPGLDEMVDVACFTPSGAPLDTTYTVSFADRTSLFGRTDLMTIGPRRTDQPWLVGYAWVDQPHAPLRVPYTAAAAYQYNSRGSADTVVRYDIGRYTVHFPNMEPLGGQVQVTAYGLDRTSCVEEGWESGWVQVACRDATGAFADSSFSVAYLNAGQT